MPRTNNPNSKSRQVILKAFRSDPGASLQELVRVTGYSQTTVYYHIKMLKAEGVIVRENLPRGRYDRSMMKKETENNRAKARSRKECERQKRAREMRNERAANFEKRIEKIVQAAKENGTYYGM